MSLELSSPLMLAGLLVLFPLLGYGFARGLVDFPRWQRVVSLIGRGIIVALLVLALAGLTWLRPGRDPFLVFLIDHSRSIDDKAQATAAEIVRQAEARRGGVRAAFLYFAAAPGAVSPEFGEPPAGLDRDGTDLAAAIEVAAGAVPPSHVPHLVLLSDGNETSGNVLRAAARAGAAVSTVPLPTRQEPEVQVSAVHLPAQVREGASFRVEVILDSNHDDEGVLDVFAGPDKVAENKNCKVKKGPNPFTFTQQATAERLVEYRATIRGFRQDTLRDNNTGVGVIAATARPRVLIVDRDRSQALPLRDALAEQGIQSDIRQPQAMPTTLTDAQNYDMLIISDAPAHELTQQQMDVARDYVKTLGGGFLMLGGDNAFGLGGYYKTLIEDVLPVRCDFSKEKEAKSMAMVLIIDRSGSMAEGQRMELAKEAARNAVELLGPRDQVGVIAFDLRWSWVSKLQTTSNKNAILDQISRLEPVGGTRLYPPLVGAHQALKTSTAQIKHVIVLTDGEVEQADFQALAGRMRQDNITVSSVGVGPQGDQPVLKQLATAADGRFYFAADPASVPQIFARETITAGNTAIREGEGFLPVVMVRTPALANIPFADAPFLTGHVRTRAKPHAETVLTTDKGEPLLVWWRRGLGVGMAFTSDARNRWAADWVGGWRTGFNRFWAQTIRYGMRKSEDRGVEVHIRQRGRFAEVAVDSVDAAGRFVNQAETELTVIDPRRQAARRSMRQTTAGRYVAAFDTPLPGVYHLLMTQRLLGKVQFQQSRALAVGFPDELRLRPTNETLLRDIAALTGGRFNPAPGEVFEPLDREARRPLPLWPYLAAAAALLFVLDVALRRVDLGKRKH